MKILVMTPVGRTSSGDQIDYFPQRWSGSSGKFKVNSFYPFSLAYLSSVLKSNTTNIVRMIDSNYHGFYKNEYIDTVIKYKPDVLIVEVDSIIFESQLLIFREIKKHLKSVIIIACGPSPTAEPEKTLSNSVDYVALGEFEFNIADLINSNFKLPANGIYPEKNKKLIDINLLPLPENNDIKRRDYCRLYGSEYNEVEMWVTRGCPVMCNFCVVTNIYYGKANYRTRNIESVIDEINYLIEAIPNLEGIFFNEEAHNFNKKYLKMFCQKLIQSGLNNRLKFNCMGNYDTLDEEIIKLMVEAGYYKMRIGIETIDQESMKFISKSGKLKSDKNKLMESLILCKKYNLKIYATMSVGTVGSDYISDINSLNNVKSLCEEGYIQEFSISINTPMPGTPFYDEALKNGWISNLTEDYSFDGAYASIISMPNYSSDDINKAFSYGIQIRDYINGLNEKNGIKYSSYDKNWCKPVYDTSNRKPGDFVI